MSRYFSGIEVPPDIAMRLALLGAPLNGARWISPDDLHLTLYFAGTLPADMASEWAHRLSMIEFAAFDVTLSQLGVFGKNRPRSIWVGIQPNEQLTALQHQHRLAAKLCGIAPETNPFKPHITLARLNGSSSDVVSSYLGGQIGLQLPSFTAPAAALFSMQPNQSGGPFPVEQRFDFIGADAADYE